MSGIRTCLVYAALPGTQIVTAAADSGDGPKDGWHFTIAIRWSSTTSSFRRPMTSAEIEALTTATRSRPLHSD